MTKGDFNLLGLASNVMLEMFNYEIINMSRMACPKRNRQVKLVLCIIV